MFQIQAWLQDVVSGTVIRVVDDVLNESGAAEDGAASGFAPDWDEH